MTDSKAFVHLHVHSEFSFCDGASHLEQLVRRAAKWEQPALALTDHDNVCGAPPFVVLCKSAGIKPILGAELTLDTGKVVVLAKNRNGFASLCQLLTRAHLTQERGSPLLEESYLLAEAQDLILLSGSAQSPLRRLLRARRFEAAADWIDAFLRRFGCDFFIELQRTCEPELTGDNALLIRFAHERGIPLVATNNVHYLNREQFAAQDVLTCIRRLIRLDDPHEERKVNSELYLKSTAEMRVLFADLPETLTNTLRITDACESYELSDACFLPRFSDNPAGSARLLGELTHAGARSRYGEISFELKNRLDYELSIITRLGFADYFLVVRDLVQFARSRHIRHAGRGSAADSAVAYCLDITKVDAFSRNLRFERFINPERANNLPDIDLDFDARYRDDVTEYVTRKYGKDHAATVCTYARFRARSAIRDVAKALGFSVEDIDTLAKSTHWATSARNIRRAVHTRPELRSLNLSERKFDLLFSLCADIDDLPRHISTHLGGVVITGAPIWRISPLQMAAKGVQVIQYDKDGVEDLHLLKLDLLCLRMLSAVEDSVTMITNENDHFDYDRLPLDDAQTFERIRAADTAGAFQIESPAQMSLHPRLKTRTYEDIVASVALIRPGPLKGDMVEPFIRRRNADERIQHIHPVMDRILGHTYGVVLYQEQVVSIAVELAGFTPGQADVLRRTISHHRSTDKMQELGRVFIQQAIQRGVEAEIAEKVFSWLEGYAGYGFCEAHAAAFGDTSYRSTYLLEHHPAEFYAAILNNEPMGFYSPATIVNEARRRGIKILYPDVQKSAREFSVESGAIRVGLKQVKGITASIIERILAARPFSSWNDFLRRTNLPRDVQENMILTGACDGFSANRRSLLYHLVNADNTSMLPFEETSLPDIQDFSPFERVSHEWDLLGFSVERHPLEFWREQLTATGVSTGERIKAENNFQKVLRAAGWVIRPHTPPTKSGKTVVFFSLEDETGLLNVTVFPSIYERYGHLIFRNPLLVVEGRKDRRGANSLVADRLWVCPPLAA